MPLIVVAISCDFLDADRLLVGFFCRQRILTARSCQPIFLYRQLQFKPFSSFRCSDPIRSSHWHQPLDYQRAVLDNGWLEVAMTESEWLTCKDPGPMLEFLRGKVSDRKLRLFACACCRRVWHLLDDPAARQTVELTERVADRAAQWDEMQAMYRASSAAPDQRAAISSVSWAAFQAVSEAYWAVRTENHAFPHACKADFCAVMADGLVGLDSRSAGCELLRDIFGNPFKKPSYDSSWCTLAVTKMAQAIYQERAFERLPVLGDALEEAGCSSPEILNHCRSEGVHVRGCFVVDGVLGKE
jgi:hypothetical protein